MPRNPFLFSLKGAAAAAAMAAVFGLVAGPAAAQKKIIAIGSDAIGGVSNSISGGVAKIVTQNTPLTVRLRAYGNPEIWLPQLNDGKLELGSHFSATSWLVYNQIDSKLKLRNLRIIRSSGPAVPLGFMVRAKSDIKLVSDLRGKRVAGRYGAHPIMRRLSEGVLATYGITLKDITVVPVAAAVEGAIALIEGRTDAAWYAGVVPKTREAHSKIGVRFLPIRFTPERLKMAREIIFPGVKSSKFRGNLPWLPKGTEMLAYDFYILASTHTDDATVTMTVKALWDKNAELRKIHAVARGFVNKAAVTLNPVIPYHPAAIAFYKEKGVWSDKADAANKAVSK